ncbi:hypothetical protein G7B40_016265 [Aetokthonos hydrillicola Thurmond2011]|jgi:hypothetical protein|uniref:Uncharacterized protein n=1 Tax=Aetokthonos hydrillicola Thurmond2011 TaxID=2712845 RepID=A0AAP5M5N5_9CYAN|nr:hypothetical protein [Aetokthonos hydrillicola]MBO3458736.1 hypothetical protein [Aetokthonos hydrillicola CCALA 1050]MBW4585484.1 hypothetical protein [Aetokthonos hydrillicola CCALA 1050]MDR9896106.1 hypothetical protein [Aetokthonos hydrillicola Thurmond2011]
MSHNTHDDNSKPQNQTVAYKSRLNSWAVARLLPDEVRPEIVTRFRSRSDAEGHLHLLRRLTPSDRFEVIFDCQREESVN